MKDNKMLFRCIILLLILCTYIYTPILVSRLKSEGKIPESLKKYIAKDEELVLEKTFKIKMRGSDNKVKVIPILSIYRIYKNGQATEEYLLWDEVNKTVVGGIEKYYSLLQIRHLLSIKVFDENKDLLDLDKDKFNEYAISYIKLNEIGNDILLNWRSDLIKRKVMKIVLIGILTFVTGGLPGLIIWAGMTLLDEYLSDMDIADTLNGRDNNFPIYYQTICFMAGKELAESSKFSVYLDKVCGDNSRRKNLRNFAKTASSLRKTYNIMKDFVPLSYAFLRYWVAKNKNLVENVLNKNGYILDDLIKFNGKLTKAISGCLKLHNHNPYKYWGYIGSVVKNGKIPAGLIKEFGGRLLVTGLDITLDYFFIKPVVELKCLIANNILHSSLIYSIANTLSDISSDLSINIIGTEDLFIRVLYYKYYLYMNLAEYWNTIAKTSPSDLENLLRYDKDNKFKEWLKEEGIDVSSPSNIKKSAGEKGEKFLEKALEAHLKVLEFSYKLDKEFNTYMEIIHRRRKIAAGVIKVNADIVLCIDVSGSMKRKFGHQKRIDVAKTAAIHFINAIIHKDVKIGIVVFETSAKRIQDLTDDKSLLKNKINSLTTSGSTALGDGIYSSVEMLLEDKGKHISAIILLTDGKSNTGRDPLDAAYYAKSNNISIYTIGIGDLNIGEFNPELLRKISNITGGIYYQVDISRGVRDEMLWEIYMKIITQLAGGKVIGQYYGKIRQGEVRKYKIDIKENTDELTVMLSYSGSLLTVKLIDPDNEVIREKNKYNYTRTDVIHICSTGIDVWKIQYPKKGTWIIEIEAINVSGWEPFLLTIYSPKIEITPKVLYINFTSPYISEIEKHVKIKESSGKYDIRNIRIYVAGNIRTLVSPSNYVLDILHAGESKIISFKFKRPRQMEIYTGSIIVCYDGCTREIPIILYVNYLSINVFLNKDRYREREPINIRVVMTDNTGKIIKNGMVKVLFNNIEYTLFFKDYYYYNTLNMSLEKGNYTLIVIGEAKNYTSISQIVKLTVAWRIGDVNRDGIVDYKDIAILVSNYGRNRASLKEDIDINYDNIIDYKDIALVIASYGKN